MELTREQNLTLRQVNSISDMSHAIESIRSDIHILTRDATEIDPAARTTRKQGLLKREVEALETIAGMLSIMAATSERTENHLKWIASSF